MNKETILNYEKEFLAWCKGESILLGAPASMHEKPLVWREVRDFNDWKPLDTVYVLNDSYSTYRKALAEGKTVQYNFGNHGINKRDFLNKWKDLDISIGILADRACPENYRIKPEEPKFKVGDWVVEIHSTTKAQVLELFDYQIRVKFCYPDAIITTDSSDFIPWAPKKGDWCWFWDYDNQPAIGKSNGVTPSSENCDFYMGNTSHPYNIPHLFQGFVFCEPYIGQLPSVIKDNK